MPKKSGIFFVLVFVAVQKYGRGRERKKQAKSRSNASCPLIFYICVFLKKFIYFLLFIFCLRYTEFFDRLSSPAPFGAGNFYKVSIFLNPGLEKKICMCYNNRRKYCFAILWALPSVCFRTPAVLTASQKCLCKHTFLLHGIITEEVLLRNPLGFALCVLSHTCGIDGFAKMFVQAHIFAS